MTVGTLRLVPMERGLTVLEKLLPQHGIHAAEIRAGWEFGRLVVDPAYRSGPELVRRCVFLGAQCLAQHTGARNIFASCTQVLARLYRRFGFKVLTNGVPADTGKSYSLIQASVREVMSASGSPQLS
jgi:N-acyl-L-homoserine lactone synthetase